MRRRHHTPDQIVRKLREADQMLGESQPMVEVCEHLEVTEQTHYRWRNQYGDVG
jgi:transposase-like protein